MGILVAPAGRLLLVLRPTITDGRITRIDAIADRGSLGQIDVRPFPD